MCGIAGFAESRHGHPIDRHILERMTRAIAHRGPNDEGFFVEDGVCLGHRRLSIIDLGGGHQPITNEDGSIVVVFNGEIYNYRKLKTELESKGHVFQTRSDTEVLVHLWEDLGEAFPARLEGMFAIAIWDKIKRTLFLARDRMGKKPLFYGQFGNELVFGSELRAMLAHPAVPHDFDREALYRYLTLDYVPTPFSMIRGVRKVAPGGSVVFANGETRTGRYHDIEWSPESALVIGRDEASDLVWRTLVDTTKDRLESEVPLGVFLSGGLDSTAVLAAMAQVRDPATIDTFTIGFSDPSYDESDHARLVADHFGTRHHEKILHQDEAADLVRDIAGIADEPLADYSILPTYLLSRFAKQYVTVALSGDGGDELFYGYETFKHDAMARMVHAVSPRGFRSRLYPWLVGLLPTGDRDMSLDYKADRFVRGLRYGRFDRHFAWVGGTDPAVARQLLRPILGDSTIADGGAWFPDVTSYLPHCRNWPDFKTLSYLYTRLYMQDGVLAKVDRASMAVALEVRSPLLDARMVDLAFALPVEHSLSGGTSKAVMRRMLARKVPESILKRPKKGFGIPLAQWLRDDIRPLVNEYLGPEKIRRDGIFDPKLVEGLIGDHMSGRHNRRKEIFAMLVFELWRARL